MKSDRMRETFLRMTPVSDKMPAQALGEWIVCDEEGH
jgi:hypothetical protein